MQFILYLIKHLFCLNSSLSLPAYVISPLSFTENNTLILLIPSLSFGQTVVLCGRLLPEMSPVTALASCCRCLCGPIHRITLDWQAKLAAKISSSNSSGHVAQSQSGGIKAEIHLTHTHAWVHAYMARHLIFYNCSAQSKWRIKSVFTLWYIKRHSNLSELKLSWRSVSHGKPDSEWYLTSV